MKRIPILALYFLSGWVYSCSDLNWSWEKDQWVSNPDEIYAGMVVGIGATDAYINKRIENFDINDIFVISHYDKDVKIRVLETLKGREIQNIEVILKACTGGWPELFGKVVLFYVNGQWHVKKYPEDEIAKHVYMALSKLGNRK